MELALDYRIYKSYQVHAKIGKGAYGQVFKATDRKTSHGVAIKKICDAFQNLTDAKRTYRQLSYLLQLSHPSIIKLQRVISGEILQNHQINPNRNVYAVFELMEMDLAKVLHLCKLEPLQRKYISMQIVSGLKYMHQSGLVHRDIKPSNILVDQSCNAKICDFGLVRKIQDFSQLNSNSNNQQQVFTEYVASRWYRAPQILLNGNQISTTQIDMWSFGCVLAEMILGQPIFNGKNTLEQLQVIFKYIGMPLEQEIEDINTEQGKFLLRNFHKFKRQQIKQLLKETNVIEQQIDLLENLLVFNPRKRLTASSTLKHSYFKQLSQEIMKFYEPPMKVADNSVFLQQKCISQKTNMLQTYRQLIQSLCVNTLRLNSSKKTTSQNSLRIQHQHQNTNNNKYNTYHSEQYWYNNTSNIINNNNKLPMQMQLMKIADNPTNLQKNQKSTRQSNYGRLQDYHTMYTNSNRSKNIIEYNTDKPITNNNNNNNLINNTVIITNKNRTKNINSNTSNTTTNNNNRRRSSKQRSKSKNSSSNIKITNNNHKDINNRTILLNKSSLTLHSNGNINNINNNNRKNSHQKNVQSIHANISNKYNSINNNNNNSDNNIVNNVNNNRSINIRNKNSSSNKSNQNKSSSKKKISSTLTLTSNNNNNINNNQKNNNNNITNNYYSKFQKQKTDKSQKILKKRKK